MDIGKAFTFVFDDKDWIVKILIAAGITLVGIVFFWLIIPPFLAAFVLSGYGVEITRRVIRGDAEVLPAWEDWGAFFTDGLKVFVIGIVYALPIIAVSICLGIPAGILSDNGESAASAFSALLSCINFLWGIVMAFLLPAAIASFVAKDDMAAAFRFGDVFALVRDNFVTYLLVAVLSWVASIIGGLGLLVCGVGVLVTAPYATWVTNFLYGAAYVEATGQAPPVLEEEFA
jgi:hypothetical protein